MEQIANWFSFPLGLTYISSKIAKPGNWCQKKKGDQLEQENKISKGLMAERQTLESITGTGISKLNLLMRKAKVIVITGSLIPKGGFQ